MLNITLVFTHHSAIGRYNTHSLCEVIHSINPEVVFEELSEKDHSIVYRIRDSIAVESDAIKMYLKHKTIDQVPVDNDNVAEHHRKNLNELFEGVANLGETEESIKRKSTINNHIKLISQHGVSFINSDENELLLKQEEDLLHKIIEQSNDVRLKQLELECKEINAKREDIIINNVYRYSGSNQYERAVMFIGSGHRTTIKKVIEQFEAKETLQINWWLF